MATRSQSAFQTVKAEGALLPADLLKRVADGDSGVEGLSPESYHLDPTDKINEATNRAWIACRDAWQRFQKQRAELPEADKGTTLTRERWLLVLFRELGFGRLQTAKAFEIGGKTYALSHGWGASPIHLISFRYDLDTTSHGVFRTSPHSLVQELLNRSDDHLWAFVSNGLQLRILRDNVSFTRPAFVEFDLEAMLEGEVYSDFLLLWLLCHQSRVESEIPEQCWLEKWHQTAKKQGTRVLDRLRDGVERSIEAFGQGFLAHRGNGALRQKLADGKLTTQDYYQQLLRLVYRLIFLFVAEDRDLLLTPDADATTRKRYEKNYSLTRIRRLAQRRRGTRHSDLWQGVKVVFKLLYKGEPRMGLPALGSMLFSNRTMPDLDECELANDRMLEAVRHLAFTVERNVLRQVDYKNLGSEELGSVYESLLELHPDVNADAATFELSTVAGSERKTTGSYYTPSSLINCLLDSALDPVVEEALKKPDREKAILDLKVCDPACGSGHFLIAAANRLSHHLATARTGDEEPSPAARRVAFRDVVSHCIYGVDINPMAVELCKVALWLESIDPGKPLSFLDHRILCGNSLIGVTPRLLAEGIPDGAFTPITGDDKAVVSEYKRRNKDEKKGQLQLDLGAMPSVKLGNLVQTFANLAAMDDGSLEDVEAKEKKYAEFMKSTGYQSARLLADAWCAVFVWKKDKSTDDCITESWFRRIEANPHCLSPWMREEIDRLRDQYQFFHWHLSFADAFRVPRENDLPDNEQAGWNGGFDIVLGNPPWEKINFRDEEYFTQTHPEIAHAANKARRKKLIDDLRNTAPVAYSAYEGEYDKHLRISAFFRYSGMFPMTGVSRINLYSVFAELACRSVTAAGRVGLVIASGIATDDNNKALFGHLVKDGRLASVYDFENRNGLFPGIHRSYKFCLFCASGMGGTGCAPDFAFYLANPTDLSDSSRHFALTYDDLCRINPSNHTAPTFRSAHEATIVKRVYARVPTPCSMHAVTCGVPKTPFNSANDSGLFLTEAALRALGATFDGLACARVDQRLFLPIYESKLIHQFNHRYASFAGVSDESRATGDATILSVLEAQDPSCGVVARNWIEQSTLASRFPGNWFLVYRDITGSVNERTSIAAVIGQRPCVHSLILIDNVEPKDAALLCGAMNSFAYDFLARQKIAGNHFNQTIWRQLPVLLPVQYAEWARLVGDAPNIGWACRHALELTYVAWDLATFATDNGYDGPPFVWDEGRRFLIRCELDAAYFHLYGLERDDVDYIMETFPIVKKKDIKKHSNYRTKDTILEIYDEMTEAMKTGKPYQTRLDPPPGPPADAEGNFLPLPQWLPGQPQPADWPSHIHPPKEVNSYGD